MRRKLATLKKTEKGAGPQEEWSLFVERADMHKWVENWSFQANFPAQKLIEILYHLELLKNLLNKKAVRNFQRR